MTIPHSLPLRKTVSRSTEKKGGGEIRRILISGALLLTFTLATPVAAQFECAQHVDTLLDTTNNCVNEPFRDRASDVEAFLWKGHYYLIFNRGNELSIFQVDDPTNPQSIDTSNFDFDTRGDSDYDLISFDVCDD